MAYYGANDVNGNDVRPRELAAEAVNLANPDVNFANYDNDNDGLVDAIYMIFAGYSEDAGGGANTIWSHAGYLTSPLYLDGKDIQRYSCSPELRGSSGSTITSIGVICHEFGHVLGAPLTIMIPIMQLADSSVAQGNGTKWAPADGTTVVLPRFTIMATQKCITTTGLRQ